MASILRIILDFSQYTVLLQLYPDLSIAEIDFAI